MIARLFLFLRSSAFFNGSWMLRRKKQWIIGLLLGATIWGFVDVRRRGFPNLDHKTDLTVYTEAGAAFFDGRPPYEVCNPRGWTYVYPPIFAMMLAPLHVLPMQEQAIAWFFLCLAMCWGIYRECGRIVALVYKPEDDQAAGQPGWFPWLGTVALGTALLPILNCLQRGQVTIIVLYLLVLGTRLVLSNRTYWAPLLGGIVLALAITIKIVPILPVAFLLFVQLVCFLQAWWQKQQVFAQLGKQWSAGMLGVGVGLLLFFLFVPAALIGWNANLRHLNTWSELVLCNANQGTATPGFDKDTHSVRNQCLGNALYRLGNFGEYMLAGGPEDPLVDDDNPPPRLMDAESVNTSVLFVRVTLLLTLLLVGVRLGMRGDPALAQAAGFGLACMVLLVVSPVARNHYFSLAAPGVLFVPLWLARMGDSRRASLLAVVPSILILLQYVFLPYVGRVGMLGLGTAGWIMAAMVLMIRASQPVEKTAVLPVAPPRPISKAA